MRRVPTRTLVLMVLSLLAFGWMYWRTHQKPPPEVPPPPREVQIVHLPKTDGGGWAAMDQALRAAMKRAYGDAGPGHLPAAPDAATPTPGADAQ